jgi:tetratricopeptide (TPR) repeat protein
MDGLHPPRSAALVQARAWADQGRWDRVLPLVPTLLAENPDELRAYTLATRAYINMAEHRTAQKFAQTCVRLGPNSADAHYLATVAAHNVGKLAQAQQHLNTALALSPNWATLHQFQARLHLRAQRNKPALAALRQAQKLAPENPEIAGDLVQLESAGHFLPSEVRETTRRFEETLALDPENPKLHLKLGQHLHDLEGDSPRALGHLATALRAKPGDPAIRRAYLAALRQTDPLIRALCAPRRVAQRFVRVLHQHPASTRQGIVLALLAVPLGVAAIFCFLIYLLFCWLPALIYAQLTLTDFRARSIGQAPGKFSLWSWSKLPARLRQIVVVLLVALPWILIGLICWHLEVLIGLFFLLMFASWLDFGWSAICWMRKIWKERADGALWPALWRTGFVVMTVGVFLALLFIDWEIPFVLVSLLSYAVIPRALRNWNRNLLH